MSEADIRVAALRHAIANPLAALLAEVQLTLSGGPHLEPDVRQSLVDIEALALRMKAILKESSLPGGASGR